jgi:hypothetical protein
MQRALSLHDPALDILLRVGPGVPLDEVHTLDHDSIPCRQYFQHSATFAAILTGHDHDVIVLPNRGLKL